MSKEFKHKCEVCRKDFEELLAYKGYEHSSLVVWMCESCFEKEYGVTYEEIE